MVLATAFGLQKGCISSTATSKQQRWSSPPVLADLGAQRKAEHLARLRCSAAAVETSQPIKTDRHQPFFEVLPAPEPSQLINDWRAFLEEHRIRGYEVGPDQHTTISSIANIIQEVASNHAVAMWGRSEEGFASDPALADRGLIFVMTRLQIQMDAYPKWGDVMQVETWFQPSGKIGAQRDFIMRCKNTGRMLGRATSTWVMINLRSRQLVKMPEEARAHFEWYAEEAPARQAIAPGYTKIKIPEVAMPAEFVGPVQVARRSDVDMNSHVNNVTCLAWGLETVPREVFDCCHLYQVEIDYKAECHCGDEVEVLAQRSALPDALANNGAGPDSLAFVHTLRRCEGEACTELVRMRTVWRAGKKP